MKGLIFQIMVNVYVIQGILMKIKKCARNVITTVYNVRVKMKIIVHNVMNKMIIEHYKVINAIVKTDFLIKII